MPRVIGMDTECFAFSRGDTATTLVCLSLAGGEDTVGVAHRLKEAFGEEVLVSTQPGRWKLLVSHRRALAAIAEAFDACDVMVSHNAAFDWSVLMRRYPNAVPLFFQLYEEGRVSCTRVRELLFSIEKGWLGYDPRLGLKEPAYSLAQCVKVHLGVDITKDKKDPDSWRLRYNELFDVPLLAWPPDAARYAMDDAELARSVYLAQNPEGPVVDELPQVRADLCLRLMATYGVRTDREAVERFSAHVRERASRAESHAAEHGWLRVNRCKSCGGTGRVGAPPELAPCPACRGLDDAQCLSAGLYKARSPLKKVTKDMTRLRAWVSHAYNGRPPMTDGGEVATDEDTLRNSGHPVLVGYAEYLSYIKLRDTYLPILAKGIDGALTSSPNVLVETGRTSWKDPNQQNPPRAPGYRDCFVARPGKVFASVDFSSEELVCLAFACLTFFGHSRLAEVINAGKDVHLWFAAKMLRIEYDVAVEWLGGSDKELKEKAKNARQLAKVGNFGIPGGMGAAALVDYARNYGVTLTLDEAYGLVREFKQAFPEIREYFDMASTATRNGPATSKALVSGRVRGGCTYTVLCNSFFQSLGADIAKAAMWQLTKCCYVDRNSPLFGCRIWNFIHDEFLLEGPEETAHVWAPEVSRIMADVASRYTPTVKQAAPPALMRRWLKKAEPVYDETGKLIPWEV